MTTIRALAAAVLPIAGAPLSMTVVGALVAVGTASDGGCTSPEDVNRGWTKRRVDDEGVAARGPRILTTWEEPRVALRVRSLGACAESGDDSALLQQALDSGSPVDFEDLSCRISTPLRVTTSGQWLFGRGAVIATTDPSVAAVVVGSAPDGSFVKTDDVTIFGLNFVGAADGIQGEPTAAAVIVRGPPAKDGHSGQGSDLHSSAYIEGNGCSRVTVRGVKESGFVFGVVATGADDITIDDSEFGGNFFFARSRAGGYGVLLQSCFGARITHNSFKATGTDRHSIYVSVDPTRERWNGNTCKRIVISGNTIDWTGVIDGTQCQVVQQPGCPEVNQPTHFEAAVMVRAAEDLVFSGNTVLGGYGGLYYEAEDGNGSRVTIAGNTVSGQAASERGERAGIEFNNSSPDTGNVTNQIAISGNVIGPFSSGEAFSHAISLRNVKDVSLTGNTIVSTGYSALRFGGNAAGVAIGENVIESRGSYVYHFCGRENDGFAIGPNMERLVAGRLYRFESMPRDVHFWHRRCAKAFGERAWVPADRNTD